MKRFCVFLSSLSMIFLVSCSYISQPVDSFIKNNKPSIENSGSGESVEEKYKNVSFSKSLPNYLSFQSFDEDYTVSLGIINPHNYPLKCEVSIYYPLLLPRLEIFSSTIEFSDKSLSLIIDADTLKKIGYDQFVIELQLTTPEGVVLDTYQGLFKYSLLAEI